MKPPEQVIIIGGGPAGAACAIQLKRYGIDPLIIEKDRIGGLVRNAWRLDNYPGYPEGISGLEMAEKISAHLKRLDIRYSILDIRYSNYTGQGFLLNSVHEEFCCEYLVIASGTKAKYQVPEGQKNVFTEVYPIRDVKAKVVDIIGAGDAAFDYAMTLSKNNEVHIHNRGTEIKCIPALLDIALKESNITYHENSQPAFSSDYTIFATGREPELNLISEELKNNMEQLEQDGRLYVIGDVKNGMVRQSSVAVGDGVRAAMAVREQMISR